MVAAVGQRGSHVDLLRLGVHGGERELSVSASGHGLVDVRGLGELVVSIILVLEERIPAGEGGLGGLAAVRDRDGHSVGVFHFLQAVQQLHVGDIDRIDDAADVRALGVLVVGAAGEGRGAGFIQRGGGDGVHIGSALGSEEVRIGDVHEDVAGLGQMIIAIEERDRLGAGAGFVRREFSLAHAVGDLVLHRPKHGVFIPLAPDRIGEGIGDARDGGLAGDTIEERDDLRAGAGLVRREFGLAHAVGDLVLHSPEHGSFIPLALDRVGEGILHIRNGGLALGAIEERDDLRAGAGFVRRKFGLAHAVGDLLRDRPGDGLGIILLHGHVRKGLHIVRGERRGHERGDQNEHQQQRQPFAVFHWYTSFQNS